MSAVEARIPVRGRLARSDRNEEAAVLVVGGKEVAPDGLPNASARRERQLLVESSHAPLDGDLGRIRPVERVEAESLRHLAPEEVVFREAGQLEEAPAHGDDTAIVVADDERGRRPRVVVVHELEQEPEATARAPDRLMRQTVTAIVVDVPPPTVRADEKGHVLSMLIALGHPISPPPGF